MLPIDGNSAALPPKNESQIRFVERRDLQELFRA
jgi:hypothetical protein